jgi:hypothetical protein
VLLSAPRLADLTLSLPPSAFRNCDSPQLASGHRQNRSKYQFAIDTARALIADGNASAVRSAVSKIDTAITQTKAAATADGKDLSRTLPADSTLKNADRVAQALGLLDLAAAHLNQNEPNHDAQVGRDQGAQAVKEARDLIKSAGPTVREKK